MKYHNFCTLMLRKYILVFGIVFLSVWLIGAVGTSKAGLLGDGGAGLTTSKPDIMAGCIMVSYDAGADSFSAEWGIPIDITMDDVGTVYSITGATDYSISMVLPESGIPTSGSLNIMGIVSELGATSGTLLTGDIAQFGYTDPPGGTGGERFEFIFDVTGGDLASYYGGTDSGQIGVILHYDNTDFYGHFNNNFSSWCGACSDTFTIPEPSSAIVLLSFVAGWALWLAGRRRGVRNTK